MSFPAYWTGSHDDFLLLGRRLHPLSITNSAKHSSQTYRKAGQRCFGPSSFAFLVIDLHPGHVKDLTSVMTLSHDWLRTTKVKFFKLYLSEGMDDPGKIIRSGR